ncbi:MAG: cytokinesis protein 3 [Trizodia sp. TS-e1964]|nr:MAG: cytokinesis protein 3 [Trizodia sp. TS-e1964]
MATAPQALPLRFPCWCRAVYSWGGETKRDLGFVEGDLIECLNAGDGSWWMGRLRRDRRMMGMFPSNFVQVLEEDFQPASRLHSPMPGYQGNGSNGARHASPNPTGMASRESSPQLPQKSKTFRKPFEAYASSTPRTNISSRGSSPLPQKSPSKAFRRPFQAYSTASSPNPTPESPIKAQHRAPSPNPNIRSLREIQASPEPPPASYSRVPSPAPSVSYTAYSRGPSPNPYQTMGSSPPPPAPPPHRVAYQPHPPQTPTHAPASCHQQQLSHTISRGPSPAPLSPNGYGNTPSPLRTAMEDVMMSLHDMSIPIQSGSPSRPRTPLDPWSPSTFDQYSKASRLVNHPRPHSSLGLLNSEEDPFASDEKTVLQLGSGAEKESPHLNNYVQRMESRLRMIKQANGRPQDELFLPEDIMHDTNDKPPALPPKNLSLYGRSQSSLGNRTQEEEPTHLERRLKTRKSAYELGKHMLGRTATQKSSSTSASSGVQSTSTGGSTSTKLTAQSIMSGHSAGGFSATSAGSLARRRDVTEYRERSKSVMETRKNDIFESDSLRKGFAESRPQTPLTGITYHSSSYLSKAESRSQTLAPWTADVLEPAGIFGGLSTPKAKKTGFFKKILESAKTGAASARSTINANQTGTISSPSKLQLNAISNNPVTCSSHSLAHEMGLGALNGAPDWVQVRRDVARSNSLSHIERMDRRERCLMMDHSAINSVDELYEYAEGGEGLDGLIISEPINFQILNFNLVDKSTRFINSLPPMTNAAHLAQGYVCRPYRSDTQRLRAIFIWASEKIAWEEETNEGADSRRVVQTRRGCAEEVAVLVMEMCLAVGLQAEVVRGYLKAPGEIIDIEDSQRPNHWWNMVVVDGEWRAMDCSLASPTNPKRGLYSSASSQSAEMWWFLTKPMELCYTHIPLASEQQHIIPPIPSEILTALPCVCPPYFKNEIRITDFDTSLLRIEGIEMVQISFTVPADIECVAEVEAKAFEKDVDGDLFESGDVVKKRSLAQADWYGGKKKYTVKAILPGDERQGVLKVYAGKKGLMHSIKDIPHPLAFALPIIHEGENPPYEFLARHPTPHAQRHDLYVIQPQCSRLAVNNTFVFMIRQHPSWPLDGSAPDIRSASPTPFNRPSSAMSMTSISASGSASSGHHVQRKPAKLAIQAPSNKILKLTRKNEGGVADEGTLWETIIKCGERGVWRGLVLADRSARWCVFAEWTCV